MGNAADAAAADARRLATQNKPLGNTYSNASDTVRKAAEAAYQDQIKKNK